MEGVVRTEVGYAGGSVPDPSYQKMADHTETLRIEYDPDHLSYNELLDLFFSSHDAAAVPLSRQYMSAVFWHDERQKTAATEAIASMEKRLQRKIRTAVRPAERFYPAEGYHQKFYLRRHPGLFHEYAGIYPRLSDLVGSTAVARVNGFAAGYGTDDDLQAVIGDLGLSDRGQRQLLFLVAGRP